MIELLDKDARQSKVSHMTSHEHCSHPSTKAARAACRKIEADSAKKFAAEQAAFKALPYHARLDREYRCEDLNQYALDQEGTFVGTCEQCDATENVVATKHKINICGRCVKFYNRHSDAGIVPIHHWTGEVLTLKTVEDVMIENDEL